MQTDLCVNNCLSVKLKLALDQFINQLVGDVMKLTS